MTSTPNQQIMKDYNNIEALLDRYWDGEATLEEERALKSYFASGEVDPRLAAEAPFFQALREERAVQSPNIGIKASATPQMYSTWQRWAAAAVIIGMVAIGGWWMNQSGSDNQASVADQPAIEQPKVDQPASLVQEEPPALAEAPAIPAAKTAVKVNRKPRPHHNRKPDAPQPMADVLDPETQKALNEVRAALALVSSKLNKGRHAATKNLNQVETFDKFFKHKKETEG